MTWNNRVMRYKDGMLGVHEVFYDDKGNIDGWTQDPIIVGDDIEEILGGLEMIRKDITSGKPILDYEK